MKKLLLLSLCCMTTAWAEPRVVFLSEQHTSATDHQAQLQALRELQAEGPVVVLAEMFTERSEAQLHAWNEGEGAPWRLQRRAPELKVEVRRSAGTP